MPLVLPYFKFNVSDWLTSEKVALMDNAQRGAYIMLLAQCWATPTCTLPNEPERLRRLVQWMGTPEDFGTVLECFTKKTTTRLTNKRLYAEWQETMNTRAELSESGRRGAEIRWQAKPQRAQRALLNGRDYRTESKAVLAFLNEKTGKQFREVEANLSMIEARLKSGVDLQTCKTLIVRKVRDWSEDAKMSHYLRPETLFNKTKFETYLAEVSE